jgi:hypothetical protein
VLRKENTTPNNHNSVEKADQEAKCALFSIAQYLSNPSLLEQEGVSLVPWTTTLLSPGHQRRLSSKTDGATKLLTALGTGQIWFHNFP